MPTNIHILNYKNNNNILTRQPYNRLPRCARTRCYQLRHHYRRLTLRRGIPPTVNNNSSNKNKNDNNIGSHCNGLRLPLIVTCMCVSRFC